MDLKEDVKELGTEKIKDILKFAFSLGNAFERSLADGKFSWEDSAHFLPVFIAAGETFQNIGDVVQEFKDLSAIEVLDLHEFIIKEFDIGNDEVEAFIEESLTLAIGIYRLVTRAIAFKKKKEVPAQT